MGINSQAVSAGTAYLRAAVTLKFAGNSRKRRVSKCPFYLRRRPNDEMDRLLFPDDLRLPNSFFFFGGSAP